VNLKQKPDGTSVDKVNRVPDVRLIGGRLVLFGGASRPFRRGIMDPALERSLKALESATHLLPTQGSKPETGKWKCVAVQGHDELGAAGTSGQFQTRPVPDVATHTN
jgi:hypothetical protein